MGRGNRRIAVIGAGAGGLTAIKALLEVGLTPVAFEATAQLGGIWVYRDGMALEGPAYRSLRTNTSKQITAFSDFPFEPDVPNFPSGRLVERYLADYARHFGLERHIRFNARVESLRRKSGGTWTVTAQGGDTETFDHVMVSSGLFRRPFIPPVSGLETFSGEVAHSAVYRVPERFLGRHVLVVGIGSSAVDIAVDLLGAASRVTLSTRRGAWIVPREIGGAPFDHRGTRLFLALPDRVRALLRRRMWSQEYERRGLDPPRSMWEAGNIPFDADTAPSVTSDDLMPRIQSNAIGARPAIERIRGREVIFADGSTLRPDAIILCTGYTLSFPFLPGDLQPWNGGGQGLYRLIFPPDVAGLAFIGICRVQGPILPIVEMQTRWAARVISGAIDLPDSTAMRLEIRQRVERQTRRGDTPLRVSLTAYLDELGREIGVKPSFLRDPRLVGALLTGPPVAAQYRLQGPDRWSGAADAIRAANATRRLIV